VCDILHIFSRASLETRRSFRNNLPETDPTFFAKSHSTDEILDEDANISELDDPGDDAVVPLDAVLNVVEGDESDQYVSGEKGV